jgi:hypothetical protein
MPDGADKIAIIGSASSSTRLAPFRDKSFAIWGCSPGVYGAIPRKDVWFETHRWEPQEPGFPEDPTAKPWFSPEYVRFMELFEGPVMMSDPLAARTVKNCVLYPFAEMIARHGPYHFASSVSWMIALAIAMKPKAIGLWGIDMAAGEEWCVSPDTRVLTSDLRWVPVGSLQVGDDLIAFDEEAGGREDSTGAYRQWRCASVKAAERLTQPCYKIVLEDGTEIISSAEHSWLTYSEHESKWRKTKDLVTAYHRADRPTRLVKLLDTWEEDRSWAAGYLAAAFDGEGHISQVERLDGNGAAMCVGFSQRENAMSQTVLDLAKAMGLDLAFVGTGGMNADCHKYRIAGGKPEVLRFLGMVRPRRLMSKFAPGVLGTMHRKDAVAVKSTEFIGEQPVIGLTTSTGTFVAEGFASHNSTQRPGCQHFLGLAISMGIEVVLPPESDLMMPNTMYGISEINPRHIKWTARLRELQTRMNIATANQNNISQEILFLKGAIENMRYCLDQWVDNDDPGLHLAVSRSAHLVGRSDPKDLLAAPVEDAKPNGELAPPIIVKAIGKARRHRTEANP